MYVLLWKDALFYMARIAFIYFCFLCIRVFAQNTDFRTLRIDKENGEQTGPAVVTVKGKPKRISSGAFQAWLVMDKQNALVIALEPKNPTGPYRLRYIEGESRKRRDLGSVPFTSAKLDQDKLKDGSWIFVLSGEAEGKPEIVVTDINGIRGRILNATDPRIEAANLVYRDNTTGRNRTANLTALMGTDMRAIYRTRNGQYAQFLSDGSAVLSSVNGQFQTGTWSTDGMTMNVVLQNHSHVDLPHVDLTPVDGVPAGSRFIVRLLRPLSSYKAKEGDDVEAVLISPAWIDGKIFIPQGSIFNGTITKARAVGWAIRRETAALTVQFTSVKLPNDQTVQIHTRLEAVENSQEKVNDKGTIQGVRSTGTLGHSAESKIASVAAVDPVAYLFTTVSSTAALGFAEPEILYPAGTELDIRFASPLIVSKVFPPTVPPLAPTPADDEKLLQFVHSLPFRTMTKGTNKPSDLTNLAFIGTRQALRNAFLAAGWVPTDVLTAGSAFRTVKTLAGNQSYNEAPMSVLLLDERPPIFTFTKTTDTFSSRHHVRVFDPALRYDGVTVLTASSTQDIGVAFSSKQKTFIHVIDQYIDNERSKIVNDLEFTGCVASAEYVPRSWVPLDAYNSTGDRLQTDGAIVVLRMTDCANPKKSPTENAVPPARAERIERDTMLTLKNDIWRGNLAYQGYSGIKFVRNYWTHKDELKSDTGAWQKTDVSGSSFKGIGTVPLDEQPSVRVRSDRRQIATPDTSALAAQEAHRWDPPRYEIAIQGGYLHYPAERVDANAILLVPEDFTNPLTTSILGGIFADETFGGWTVGISFTANTWKWFSNQFSYNYQRGKYLLVVGDLGEEGDAFAFESQEVGLVTRQFDYNLLFNLRPPKSRWRPYLAVGPALQLISLADAPLKKAPAAFKVGLQNVGTLLAAFNFAGDPPLEGGGIFQLGLEYGAGIKFRVHPRITLSADFRETWSKNPRFVTDTFTNDYFYGEDFTQYDISRAHEGSASAFLQDRFSGGIAFTF
jgi:LssY C-terminus